MLELAKCEEEYGLEREKSKINMENISQEKTYNDELIKLIENILSICDGIREVRGRTKENISIKARGCKEEILYNGQEHGFAEELLNYVLFACQDSCFEYDITCLSKDTHGNVVKTVEMKYQSHGLKFSSMNGMPNFAKIKLAVSQLFIEDELKNEFQSKLNAYEDMIRFYQENNRFLERTEIKKCLLTYIDILTFMLKHEELLEDIGKKEVLMPLLNFCDVDIFNEEINSIGLSLYSPISLYLLLSIYCRIDEYLLYEISDNEESFKVIFHEIFAKKVLHAYRWFLAGENNLYHAALSTFVEFPSDECNLLVPVHRLEDYDSYEGVRELRLAEKVLFELDTYRNQNKEKIVYRVAILGDLQRQRVEELGSYLEKLIKNNISGHAFSDIKFHFDIYTKTRYEDNQKQDDKGIYSYDFKSLSKILKSKEQVDALFANHQLIFLLDNLDLYGKIFVEEYFNPEFYKQRLKYYNYDKVLDEIENCKDIECRGVFIELYESMSAYVYSGKWGRFKKIANNSLLQYLESKVYNEQDKKAVYVYVSDLEAFHELYCNDKYFVRKEQYANKQIGIIRYSAEEEKILTNTKDDVNVLVFDMWQFVKHIAIDKREFFLNKLLGNSSYIADLKQIYIGIHYNKWRQKLVLDYYLDGIKDEDGKIGRNVNEFICKTIIPLLNKRYGDMYDGYIHQSICSFLYSDAKNVEDMLFIHLLKNHYELIGEAEITSCHEPEQVWCNVSRKFKYSFKRFYEMLLESYDISAIEYIGQYQTIDMIEKSLDLKNALSEQGDKKTMLVDRAAGRALFEQIVEACEKINYTESYIYDRSKQEMQKG